MAPLASQSKLCDQITMYELALKEDFKVKPKIQPSESNGTQPLSAGKTLSGDYKI